MENINAIQLKILSILLFNPKARFKELNSDKLATDLFSYHIRALSSAGLITKNGTTYALTNAGKMLASKIDTDTHKLERQPKPTMILIPHKILKKQKVFLIQQGLKEPYYGYWGFITGKIRFGDTLAEAAERELTEECGLTGKARFLFEIHEMVYNKATGEQLEDKLFHVMELTNLVGEPKDTKEGANKLVTIDEFRKITPKYHNEDDFLTWFLKKDFKFKEEKYYIDRF